MKWIWLEDAAHGTLQSQIIECVLRTRFHDVNKASSLRSMVTAY